VHLSRGPRENAARPSVNPLFRSAARTYGPRVVGVILTGSLDDGAAGLIVVEECGGVTIVQDPEEADFKDMPQNALTFVDADYVLPVAEIAPRLVSLSQRAVAREDPMEQRSEPVEEVPLVENQASGLACPECHGALWEVREGELLEYRCRIGHLYSPETLMHHLTTRSIEEVESAYRALAEEVSMAEKMLERARARNAPTGRTALFKRRVDAARARVEAVGRALALPGPTAEPAD
jgi:two-component system chemotaxis response regulator CheB